jgi:hypothetical protein
LKYTYPKDVHGVFDDVPLKFCEKKSEVKANMANMANMALGNPWLQVPKGKS